MNLRGIRIFFSNRGLLAFAALGKVFSPRTVFAGGSCATRNKGGCPVGGIVSFNLIIGLWFSRCCRRGGCVFKSNFSIESCQLL